MAFWMAFLRSAKPEKPRSLANRMIDASETPKVRPRDWMEENPTRWASSRTPRAIF
jgi:hypothetical protein